MRKNIESALIGRIGVRHPAVAPFGDARQSALMMPTKPHLHLARSGPRVDAGVLDRVPPALEVDMRLGPQRLHDLHLLLRAPPTVVEILVEPGKLDLVPADPDAEPEAAAAQHVETGRLFGDEDGLALRQDQDTGREAEFRRATGEIAEQYKRVMEQPGPGAAWLGRTGFTGAEHVVGRLDKVEADRLG